MKYIYLLLLINLGLIFSCSSNNQIAKYGHGNVTVFIEQGKAWKHNFPLFWGIINNLISATLLSSHDTTVFLRFS